MNACARGRVMPSWPSEMGSVNSAYYTPTLKGAKVIGSDPKSSGLPRRRCKNAVCIYYPLDITDPIGIPSAIKR
jgi:hypothetical protein